MIAVALLLWGCVHLDCKPVGNLDFDTSRGVLAPRVVGVMGGISCNYELR